MRNLLILALSLAAYAHDAVSAEMPRAAGREVVLSDARWKLFIPQDYQHHKNHVVDLLVHFHGDPPTVRKNARYARLNAPVLTINYNGLSRAYAIPFEKDSALFASILRETLQTLRRQAGYPKELKWGRVGVSSFSAGYGAVRELLKSEQYRNRIDALLLADSLYASTAEDDTPEDAQMVDFNRYAGLAAAGKKTFLLSHCQLDPVTYESTVDTSDEILRHLKLKAKPIHSKGLGKLVFYRYAEKGKFRLWGELGKDGEGHMEHLRSMGFFLKEMPLAKIAGGFSSN